MKRQIKQQFLIGATLFSFATISVNGQDFSKCYGDYDQERLHFVGKGRNNSVLLAGSSQYGSELRALLYRIDKNGMVIWERLYGKGTSRINSVVDVPKTLKTYTIGSSNNFIENEDNYCQYSGVSLIEYNRSKITRRSCIGNMTTIGKDLIEIPGKGLLIAGSSQHEIIDFNGVRFRKDKDVFLSLVNYKGEVLKEKYFGGSNNDFGVKVTTDQHYIYVLAETHSQDWDVTNPIGEGDIWILKLDRELNLIWEKSFGTRNNDSPQDFAVHNGQIYVCGINTKGYDLTIVNTSGQLVKEVQLAETVFPYSIEVTDKSVLLYGNEFEPNGSSKGNYLAEFDLFGNFIKKFPFKNEFNVATGTTIVNSKFT